jgi:hypothetical protein
LLGCVRWEVYHGVEARRQAGEPHARSVLGERLDGYLAAGGVFGAHSPQVPVVSASLDEQGQCELIQSR